MKGGGRGASEKCKHRQRVTEDANVTGRKGRRAAKMVHKPGMHMKVKSGWHRGQQGMVVRVGRKQVRVIIDGGREGWVKRGQCWWMPEWIGQGTGFWVQVIMKASRARKLSMAYDGWFWPAEYRWLMVLMTASEPVREVLGGKEFAEVWAKVVAEREFGDGWVCPADVEDELGGWSSRCFSGGSETWLGYRSSSVK